MMQTDKKYLITGGVGFLGLELINRLILNGFHNLRVISRDEGKLIELKEMYPFVEIQPGDLVSHFDVHKACQDVDGVFHLAAMKHVGLAEENPTLCIESNVIGTMNLLSCSQECDFVLGVSTDKAANVKGVYGASKLLMESLFKEYENLNGNTEYRIVRYGNVWGSTGSIATKWKEKMSRGEEVILTDPEATRFYWTVREAVALIFECLEKAPDSTPYITKMKAADMDTVLRACMEKYGKVKVNIIGLQKGENLHETIDGVNYSDTAERYTKEEFIKKFL